MQSGETIVVTVDGDDDPVSTALTLSESTAVEGIVTSPSTSLASANVIMLSGTLKFVDLMRPPSADAERRWSQPTLVARAGELRQDDLVHRVALMAHSDGAAGTDGRAQDAQRTRRPRGTSLT